jgi:chromosome condensin MukBEF complex kleisin-like MukF subunit
MTWHETRARWRILREIAAASDTDPTGELPWNDEYAEVFGDREQLVAALRYRLANAERAQMDLFLSEPVLEERLDDLRVRHAGVVRILERHDAEKSRENLAHAS